MIRSRGIVVLLALPLFACVSAHDVDTEGSTGTATGSTAAKTPSPVVETAAVKAQSLACAKDPVDELDGLNEHLECAGLYSDIKSKPKTFAQGVMAYTPGVTLWSDGATKNRWISLPKGKKIDASSPNDWVFPVGTKFFKEFIVDNHRIETRMFQKLSDHWVKATYRWNSAEDSATRSLGEDITVSGNTYHLPTGKECDECHQGRKDRSLGFEQIAMGLDAAEGLTLASLVKKGLISPAPDETSATIDGEGTNGADVIGWLHINCGVTCHNDNPSAAAHSTKLRMRLDVNQLLDGSPASKYPTFMTAIGVAATTARWGGKTRIVPGDPENSLLYQLISVRGGGENDQMPPIASRVVDQTHVDMIADWIRSLPAAPAAATTTTANVKDAGL